MTCVHVKALGESENQELDDEMFACKHFTG